MCVYFILYTTGFGIGPLSWTSSDSAALEWSLHG